jgi:actin-related protein 8
LIAYTTAFVPGLVNVKNPAGSFVQKEFQLNVWRQVTQNRLKLEKEAAEAEKKRREEAGEAAEPQVRDPLFWSLVAFASRF